VYYATITHCSTLCCCVYVCLSVSLSEWTVCVGHVCCWLFHRALDLHDEVCMCMHRTLADGLQMLDPFVRFVLCNPSRTVAYQQLRLSLMSTLCLKSVDNLPLICYLLNIVPLMPVINSPESIDYTAHSFVFKVVVHCASCICKNFFR